MSFGYSVGDFILLTQVAYNTVQNARKACGVHDNLTREVNTLHVVLSRLELEVSKPDSLLNRKEDNRRKELATLGSDCRRVLGVLSQILEKYNALSDEKRSVTKLWQRVRFGNGEMQDLDKIRGELTTYTQAMTLFLNMVAIGSQGKVEKYMDTHGKELRDIKRSLHWVTANLQASGSSDEKSILTSYTEDDKQVWKAFRRELIKEGFSSRSLGRHKNIIKKYVLELGHRGLLDEMVHSEVPLEGVDLDGACGAYTTSPSTHNPSLVFSENLVEDTTSEEEEDSIENEMKKDPDLVAETLTNSEGRVHSKRDRNEYSIEESITSSGTSDDNDENPREATTSRGQRLCDVTIHGEQDIDDDTTSLSSSDEDDSESLLEGTHATEGVAEDDLIGPDFRPKTIQHLYKEGSERLQDDCFPSVTEVEDEEFLPGAHPNCSDEDVKEHVSFLSSRFIHERRRPQIPSTISEALPVEQRNAYAKKSEAEKHDVLSAPSQSLDSRFDALRQSKEDQLSTSKHKYRQPKRKTHSDRQKTNTPGRPASTGASTSPHAIDNKTPLAEVIIPDYGSFPLLEARKGPQRTHAPDDNPINENELPAHEQRQIDLDLALKGVTQELGAYTLDTKLRPQDVPDYFNIEAEWNRIKNIMAEVKEETTKQLNDCDADVKTMAATKSYGELRRLERENSFQVRAAERTATATRLRSEARRMSLWASAQSAGASTYSSASRAEFSIIDGRSSISLEGRAYWMSVVAERAATCFLNADKLHVLASHHQRSLCHFLNYMVMMENLGPFEYWNIPGFWR
ncbi:hypothetical protein EG329_012218 [Mollisiaceae sp. DMI_Dod_QoI]|nr:hypothetical protein EG329_012218 [Helotiales sp. DMI_Dod_QoI]